MAHMLALGLALLAASAGVEPAYQIRTDEDAITIAKQLCVAHIPTDGTPVHWFAISSDQLTWSGWHEFGPGWEVHGRFNPPASPSIEDIVVFIPAHGKPSECLGVLT